MNGFMVAAPHSGSGKTVLTLGLLRALQEKGVAVVSAKAGPDYIDPSFHVAATGKACVNLDPWGMRADLILHQAAARADNNLLAVEAMMGLFDGAADDTGSAADLAALLGLPILFVVDASRMGQSIAALVEGFSSHRPDIAIAGIILNKVGSQRHRNMLERALAPLNLPILGIVPSRSDLSLPSRHLGLVQAQEHTALEDFIARAAETVATHCDLDRIASLGFAQPQTLPVQMLPPLGQYMAVARDEAFSFIYPHLLDGWVAQGASVSFFSPLANEAPNGDADAIFLPGGYPELHAEKLSAASSFRQAMRNAAQAGVLIYGECGGYMALGDTLIDGEGMTHKMLGLLPLATNFAKRTRHLGYRELLSSKIPGWELALRGHEFHYSSIETIGETDPLFHASDAAGTEIGHVGQRVGNVMGSYMHVIDRAA